MEGRFLILGIVVGRLTHRMYKNIVSAHQIFVPYILRGVILPSVVFPALPCFATLSYKRYGLRWGGGVGGH